MKHTLLVIEDESTIRNDMAEILLFEGFEVLTAENGLEGLRMAIDKLPDLIVTDLMMPEMDGYELLTALRENPQTRLIPVVIVTAMADKEDIRTGMNMGADDYLVKPFTRHELLNAIQIRLQKVDFLSEKRHSDLQELRLQLIKYLPHELNTPLNGIIGIGQILRDYPDSLSREEIADFGLNIYDSGMRLYRLIQNYLLYSELVIRHESVSSSAPLENPGDLCQSILMNIATKYKRLNDAEIDVEACDALIGYKEFSKILEELFDNAFKFSQTGSKVKINCCRYEKRFRLTIEDKGQGMTSEELHKIGASVQFNRTLYEQQGSGMGLSIARMIIEMYGGELLIESELHKGTSITIFLNAPTL